MPPTLIFVPGGLHDYGAIASGTGVLAPVIRGEASALTSVMGLCNSILGAGLLSLPWAFAQAGWAVGLALLAASGAASAFGLHLLTACRQDLLDIGAVAKPAEPVRDQMLPLAVAAADHHYAVLVRSFTNDLGGCFVLAIISAVVVRACKSQQHLRARRANTRDAVNTSVEPFCKWVLPSDGIGDAR